MSESSQSERVLYVTGMSERTGMCGIQS